MRDIREIRSSAEKIQSILAQSMDPKLVAEAVLLEAILELIERIDKLLEVQRMQIPEAPVRSFPVNIGQSATLIIANRTRAIKRVLIHNVATLDIVWLGDASVQPTYGVPLDPDHSIQYTLAPEQSLYGVVLLGPAQVRVVEM